MQLRCEYKLGGLETILRGLLDSPHAQGALSH